MKTSKKQKRAQKLLAFAKRNAIEMFRDPVIYIFCLAFPVAMIALFHIIGKYAQGMPVFELPSLIPGIMMFSFTFVMLTESLLVSKDRASAFLVRLCTLPMKTSDFVFGYILPCIVVGIGQEIVCLLTGFFFSLASGGSFFGFWQAAGLMFEMLPMLFICIFLGILFGSVLGEKSAPGVTSVFITAAGILGGAWMPLETIGGFETFCRFLPFYPSVYIGRAITGVHAFDEIAAWGIFPIAVFLIASLVLSLYAFGKNLSKDKR